jgi:hypothetical protein
MDSTKGVIRIIKKADHPDGYDEHYYFADVVTDINGHLMARNTSNIWDAMKFIYVYTSNDEWKRISSLIEFVKTCYTPKKNYIIEFIPIELKY